MAVILKENTVGFVAGYLYTRVEIAKMCKVKKDTVDKWTMVTGKKCKGGNTKYLKPAMRYHRYDWYKGEDILSFLVKTNGWKYIVNSLKL